MGSGVQSSLLQRRGSFTGKGMLEEQDSGGLSYGEGKLCIIIWYFSPIKNWEPPVKANKQGKRSFLTSAQPNGETRCFKVREDQTRTDLKGTGQIHEEENPPNTSSRPQACGGRSIGTGALGCLPPRLQRSWAGGLRDAGERGRGKVVTAPSAWETKLNPSRDLLKAFMSWKQRWLLKYN